MIQNNRSKNWFLCIQKNASCFEHLAEILQQESNLDYAYIIHDKGNDFNEKGLHYHLVLMYQNARTFASIKKKFDGAHIEPTQYTASAIQYLIHYNNPEKVQYTIYDITSNMPNIASYFTNTIEPFDENNIVNYYEDGCKTLLMFYNRFGGQIARHIQLIKEILKELDYEAWNKRQLYNKYRDKFNLDEE